MKARIIALVVLALLPLAWCSAEEPAPAPDRSPNGCDVCTAPPRALGAT